MPKLKIIKNNFPLGKLFFHHFFAIAKKSSLKPALKLFEKVEINFLPGYGIDSSTILPPKRAILAETPVDLLAKRQFGIFKPMCTIFSRKLFPQIYLPCSRLFKPFSAKINFLRN